MICHIENTCFVLGNPKFNDKNIKQQYMTSCPIKANISVFYEVVK